MQSFIPAPTLTSPQWLDGLFLMFAVLDTGFTSSTAIALAWAGIADLNVVNSKHPCFIIVREKLKVVFFLFV